MPLLPRKTDISPQKRWLEVGSLAAFPFQIVPFLGGADSIHSFFLVEVSIPPMKKKHKKWPQVSCNCCLYYSPLMCRLRTVPWKFDYPGCYFLFMLFLFLPEDRTKKGKPIVKKAVIFSNSFPLKIGHPKRKGSSEPTINFLPSTVLSSQHGFLFVQFDQLFKLWVFDQVRLKCSKEMTAKQ